MLVAGRNQRPIGVHWGESTGISVEDIMDQSAGDAGLGHADEALARQFPGLNPFLY